MLDFLKSANKATPRTVDVGWLLMAEKAGFIWEAPTRLSAGRAYRSKHSKSVSFCPAVIDHEARLFQVTCPIDLQLRVKIDDKTQKPVIVSTAGDGASIRPRNLRQMLHVVDQQEWRDPSRPMFQIGTPYLFVADEPTYVTQFPAFHHCPAVPLPGVVIGGRFPIHVWPRHLSWAFEWHDVSRELILRRGEPWFYVRFEASDPSRPVRLLEAEVTPELTAYVNGLSSVTNFVNRTFSLFETAKSRRPKQLLVPKKR
jgi:hypothetical protein